MHLHDILSQISPHTGDSITISRMDGALTNACYHLKSPDQCYALRINRSTGDRFGIDRIREQQILTAIQSHGFAPKVIDSSEHWLLTRWVDGQTPDTDLDTDQLNRLFSAVHQTVLNDTVAALDVTDQIRRLMANQCRPLSPETTDHIEQLCQTYQMPAEKTLCFHDWHPGNLILSGDHLTLIDWEYAAPGDRAVDLACLIQGLALSEITAGDLAHQQGVSESRLSRAMTLTRLMSELWYGARFADYTLPSVEKQR